MQFWHPDLLQQVSRQQLSTLHAHICKVRSRPWGKPTARTWYFNLSWGCLVWYHSLVIREMQARGWRVCVRWLDYSFRGVGREPASGYEIESDHLQELESVNPSGIERQSWLLRSYNTP